MSAPSGHKLNWPELLTRWLRRKWPRASIRLENGAIGATGSSFFALCAETRLPARPDLVVLEHALNDGEQRAATDGDSLQSRALVYEVLVRRLLARPHPPALLFLNWDRLGWCANMEASPKYIERFVTGGLRGAPWLATPQVAVDLVARWYGLPSIAPRNAIWHRDCEDLPFRGAFCDSGGLNGCGHLSSFGTGLVGHILTSFFQEATAQLRLSTASRSVHPPLPLASRPPREEERRGEREAPEKRRRGGGSDERGGREHPAALPSPLFSAAMGLRPGATGQCARGDSLRYLPSRVLSGDWHFVRRDPGQAPSVDKPGFLSMKADSILELDVGSTPVSAVAIAYLRSYDDRMGVLRVSCVTGCACNATDFSSWHIRKSSILAMGLLALREPAPRRCKLRVEHHQQTLGKKEWGSKVKLLAVITPPFAIDLSDAGLNKDFRAFHY